MGAGMHARREGTGMEAPGKYIALCSMNTMFLLLFRIHFLLFILCWHMLQNLLKQK